MKNIAHKTLLWTLFVALAQFAQGMRSDVHAEGWAEQLNAIFFNVESRMAIFSTNSENRHASEVQEQTSDASSQPSDEDRERYFSAWRPYGVNRIPDGGPLILTGRTTRIAFDRITITESSDPARIKFRISTRVLNRPESPERSMTKAELRGLSKGLSNYIASNPTNENNKDYAGIIDQIQKFLAANPSGIKGTVTLGPLCGGPSRPDKPCPDKPYPAKVTIKKGDKVVAEVQADDQGQFSVSLDPGVYEVVAQSNGRTLPRAPSSQTVTVVDGQVTSITLKYDTGIR